MTSLKCKVFRNKKCIKIDTISPRTWSICKRLVSEKYVWWQISFIDIGICLWPWNWLVGRHTKDNWMTKNNLSWIKPWVFQSWIRCKQSPRIELKVLVCSEKTFSLRPIIMIQEVDLYEYKEHNSSAVNGGWWWEVCASQSALKFQTHILYNNCRLIDSIATIQCRTNIKRFNFLQGHPTPLQLCKTVSKWNFQIFGMHEPKCVLVLKIEAGR